MISEKTRKKIEDLKTGVIIILIAMLALGASREDIDEAKARSYKRGYEEGQLEKQSYWYDMGYGQGLNDGGSDAYNTGYENGYFEGYDDCLAEYGLVKQETYIPQKKKG